MSLVHRPIRRMVAGPNAAGKTRILFDGPAPRRLTNGANGMQMTDLWTSDETPPTIEPGASDPTLQDHIYFPTPGGTRFMVNRITSAAERRKIEASTDVEAANLAFFQSVPGMVETFEPGGDGMHTSPTIDYGLILEGEIDLELDDGEITRMAAGDSYVLKAARHRWHPLEDVGCVIAVVLVGVDVGSTASIREA